MVKWRGVGCRSVDRTRGLLRGGVPATPDIVGWGVRFVVLVGLACGPGAPAESETTAGEVSGGLGTAAPTATAGTEAPPTSTSGPVSTSGGDASTSGEGACSDSAGPAETEGAGGCDVLVQDCACEQKCAPVGLELGCVPLAEEPVGVGGECGVDPQGRDRCARGSFCPAELFATPSARCVALCDGEGAGCPADTPCVGLGAGFGLCLHACDPLAPACAAGEACASPFPTLWPDARFACLPAGGEGGLCDGCRGPTGCSSGFACRPSFSCGIDDGSGACTPYCDLDLPACPEMLACVPWYVDPPPGLERVGACA